MSIPLKKPYDIEKLRVANKVVANVLSTLKNEAKEGVALLELDKIAEDIVVESGFKPSFKGLYGFPNSLCTSVNEVIIHGIPTDYRLKNGDIVGFDIGVDNEGYFGDGAITVGIGEVSEHDKKLIACSKDALYYAIDSIKVDMRFKEISKLIEDFILGRDFVPLNGFCGHGIGKRPHEEPQIPNYVDTPNVRQGPKVKNGMVFCLEPMVCSNQRDYKILDDKWSVVSTDGLNCSHYEHSVAMVDNRVEILSII